MEMKWHPIVNGDLSEVPRDEDIIFTVLDERTGKNYTEIGAVSEPFINNKYIFVGKISYRVDTKLLKAWMEIPEAFHPNDCNMCAHYRVWIDGFGDRWSKCELWNEPFAMADCQLR